MQSEKVYTITELAKIFRISVRTLRHYEDINLLKAKRRNSSNHRVYETSELIRLQQIMFFKELDFNLKDIKKILTSENHNLESVLKDQKYLLKLEIKRLNKLVKNIEKTILSIKNPTMLTDEEIYEGMSKDEIQSMKQEVKQKYDPKLVAESNRRVKSMTKEQLVQMKQQGNEILTQLGKLVSTNDPSSKAAQKLVGDYYEYINENFYTPTPEIYRGLADLYVSDPRFIKTFEDITPGLANFMSEAIKTYCKNLT